MPDKECKSFPQALEKKDICSPTEETEQNIPVAGLEELEPAATDWIPQIGDRVWREIGGETLGVFVIVSLPGDIITVMKDGLPYEKASRWYRLQYATGEDTAIYECGKAENLRLATD